MKKRFLTMALTLLILCGISANFVLVNAESTDLNWEQPSASLPLGSASHFGVVSFGNYSVAGADVESGCVVGGDFYLPSGAGYSVGLPIDATNSWGWWTPGYRVGNPINVHNPRFVVQGSAYLGSGVHVYGGNIYVGDKTKISGSSDGFLSSWEYMGTGAYNSSTDKNSFKQTVNTSTSNNYTLAKEDPSGIASFLSNAQSSLKALSAQQAAPKASSTVLMYNVNLPANGEVKLQPSLSGGDYSSIKTIVYNLTCAHSSSVASTAIAANETGIASIDLIVPESFKGNIVVNMLPDKSNSALNTFRFVGGSITINGSSKLPGASDKNGKEKSAAFHELARAYGSRVLFNYPDSSMTVIKMRAIGIIGSMLAPYSDFNVDGGSVNGNLVVKSLTANGGYETHNIPYVGGGESGEDDTDTRRLGWMRSTEIPTESFLRSVGGSGDAWNYSQAFKNTPIKYFQDETVRATANARVPSGGEYTVSSTQQMVGMQHIWDAGTYFPLYKEQNGNTSYSWASWKHHGISGYVEDKGEYSIRRITAYLDFSASELASAKTVMLAPEDELGNMSYLFPINDNVFVFVNGQLAFWGGTDVIAGNNQYGALNRTAFGGLDGIKVRNGVNGVLKNYYPHTDGWCIDLEENSAAVNIKSYLKEGFNRIDIFADEYWEGGGMNQLNLYVG